MRKRSRAHEAGSIEADSRKAKRFGFRWPGRAPRSDQSSQIEPARTPRRASSSQPGRQGQPDRASRGQIEPARAPGAARSSQSRPDRASQGEPGRSAGRPADRAVPCWTAGRAISLLIYIYIYIHIYIYICYMTAVTPLKIEEGMKIQWPFQFKRKLYAS